MSLLRVYNGVPFRTAEIEFIPQQLFKETVMEKLRGGLVISGMFPLNRTERNKLIILLSDRDNSSFVIAGGIINGSEPELESMSEEFPHAEYFECELAEKYGYKIKSHPGLRPVRDMNSKIDGKAYRFYRLEGESAHEVAVGPIHAGIIEPGHFRFQCHGETVYNLEISLGYQKRGVDKMLIDSNPVQRIILAESIAGDTVMGHAHAHCLAIEALAGINPCLRRQAVRVIASELERIAMNISGLLGISNDIGFAIVSSSYGRLRTLVINSLAELSGSRFGRGLFAYGGLRHDMNDDVIKVIKNNLETVKNDIKEINRCLLTSSAAILRFEKTGIVLKKDAEEMALTGNAARASGLACDARVNYPYCGYRYMPVSMISIEGGDVFSRTRLRVLDIEESMKFVDNYIDSLPEAGTATETYYPALQPGYGVVSVTEGFRGEIFHGAFTGEDSKLTQYYIKDPSFNNWQALSFVMQNTDIYDFPICNKSFDLSYSGHDL
ncbi:MAG: hydrogenase [Candidatus Goldiibacteriota bacterium HGW-Goldbacteria-1]|jgi:Ni,Fe-hydrogenase III large subunit|nr:MAG: hydrogenase [Candidatus Goldiibacteriota bacterium HGW-Goldbacteria-1]